MAGTQRRSQRLFIHHAAAAAIHEQRAGLHGREEVGAQALLGLREEWQQHADGVAGSQHVAHLDELDVQLPLGRGRQAVTLIVEHRAAEAAQPPRQFRADLAHTEDAHRAPPQAHHAPAT